MTTRRVPRGTPINSMTVRDMIVLFGLGLAALLLSADTSLAQDSGTGVELSGRTPDEAPPEYWYLDAAEKRERMATVPGRWGFAAVPPGRYVLTVQMPGQSEVRYTELDIREGETKSVSLDTGVELLGRTPQDLAPSQWTLRDADTKTEVAKVWRRWGFAALPPGRYSLSLALPDQAYVPYRDFEVRKGETETVTVDTGVELLGRTPQDVAPSQWILHDADTTQELTKVWRRWGFAALPPGRYSLTIAPSNQTAIEYAKFELKKGQVKSFRLDAGIELVAGAPDEIVPENWQVYDVETGNLVAQYRRPWGRVWLPPGRYVLSFYSAELNSGKSEVIDVKQGRIAKVTLSDLGLEATPQARPVGKDERIGGYNIALAELGGKIESTTSPGDGKASSAQGLIDGLSYVPDGRRCRRICGWTSAETSPFPHEFVFSFFKGRQARVSAVAFDPITWETTDSQALLPRHVEIWVSTTSPNEGFNKVAAGQLQPSLDQQVIEFPATAARYVKLRVLSNHGSRKTSLGEVKIMEAAPGPSILDDAPRDLARPENGGAIVWFTSQGGSNPAAQLLWQGDWHWKAGWNSAAGAYGPATYLPQDVVFAFRGDREALVGSLVVDPTGLDLDPHSPYGAPSLARRLAVLVSTKTPLEGFEKVGEFILEPEARPQTFAIGRRARFVKLRILETQGVRTGREAYKVQLGKIKLLEGKALGYTSILKGLATVPEAYKAQTGAPIDETEVLVESEPNDTSQQANSLLLARWTKGTIDPLGEADHFRIPVPGDEPAILNVELKGHPDIRASAILTDPEGRAAYSFDPGSAPARETSFSLKVRPGDYLVKMTQPINSVVLLWDASGSMKGRIEDLQEAILGYLGQVGPTEQLNLIRFDEKVEVLLPAFSSDPARLRAAAEGKFALGRGTALYDAIDEAMDLLEGVEGNRAIVIMTDGEDFGSDLDHAGLWRILGPKRARIYAIGLGRDMSLYSRRIGSSAERFLGHMALATNGRAFFAETSEDLQGLYRLIAEDLRATTPYYLKPDLGRDPGKLSVASTGELIAGIAAPRFELILDASGSMRDTKRMIEGQLKIDVAKKVMTGIIDELPPQSEVALRVYGHRIKEYKPGDCEDSELLFSFQKVNKAALKDAVKAIEVRSGTTPLAYSLVQAAKDLAGAPGDKLIVLVTDGEEYCGASPEKVASTLVEHGMPIRVEVVGFALADEAVKETMTEVAEITGGGFHDAGDTTSLRKAIREALAAPFEVLDAAGASVAGGVVNRGPVEVPQGVYTVVIRAGHVPIEFRDVRVVQGKFTQIRLEKQGEEIGKTALGPAAGADEPWAAEMAAQPVQPATSAAVGKEPVPDVHAALAKLEAEVVAAIVNRPPKGSSRAASVSQEAAPRVRRAQEQLAALGFDPGGADGKLGPNTARAVREFQKWYPNESLLVTGKLDARTLAALEKSAASPRTEARTLSVDRHLNGLLFNSVARGLRVMRIEETPEGLRVDDLITEVDGAPVRDPGAFVEAINGLRRGARAEISLEVERGGALLRFVVKNAATSGRATATAAPAAAPETTVDLIGDVMDSFDRTMMAGLFDFKPRDQVTRRWSNPATGQSYVATAEPVLDDGTGACRMGTVETALNGKDKTYYYAACRRAGRWAYSYVTDKPVWLTTQ